MRNDDITLHRVTSKSQAGKELLSYNMMVHLDLNADRFYFTL